LCLLNKGTKEEMWNHLQQTKMLIIITMVVPSWIYQTMAHNLRHALHQLNNPEELSNKIFQVLMCLKITVLIIEQLTLPI